MKIIETSTGLAIRADRIAYVANLIDEPVVVVSPIDDSDIRMNMPSMADAEAERARIVSEWMSGLIDPDETMMATDVLVTSPVGWSFAASAIITVGPVFSGVRGGEPSFKVARRLGDDMETVEFSAPDRESAERLRESVLASWREALRGRVRG